MTSNDRTADAESPPRFPRPPQSCTDREGRSIEIRAGFPRAALVSMYLDFDPESRAQGLPPATEDRIENWLDVLEEGINVVAWDVDPPADCWDDDDCAVGHACLLDCGDGTSELTIFVHQDYQLAGIGSRLIRTLLGAGQAGGIDHVWLTVERSNHVAMNLYRSVGFETTSAAGIEHEMETDI